MVRLALIAAVALGLGACNTSYSYFKEERPATQGETTMFGTLMTMTGIVPEQRERVESRPRPPLAIPGTTDLPDPDAATSAEASVNFPVDDDERRRQDLERLRSLGDSGPTGAERLRDNTMDTRSSPEEVQALRLPGGGLSRRGGDLASITDRERRRLTREELKVQHTSPRANRRALLTEDGAPAPRNSLLLPPDSYRTPADTAELPERGDIENSEWVKKRVYSVDDRRPARLSGSPLGLSGN
jgi:hypothetical protein